MIFGPVLSSATVSSGLMHRPVRVATAVLGGIAAVFLCWHVVHAMYLSRQVPKPALLNYWQDDSAVAELIAIQKDMVSGATRPQGADYVASLVVEHHAAPLERRTIHLLMSAMELIGQRSSAESLDSLAAGLGLRDVSYRSLHTERLMAAGRYVEAARSYEALLRIFSDVAPLILTDMANRSSIDAFRAAVLDRLVASPPWRRGYLTMLRDLNREGGLYFDVVEALRARGVVLSTAEFGDYLSGLVQWRSVGEAHAAWVDFNRRRGVEVAYGLFDGAFVREPDGIPFGWVVSPVKSVVKTLDRGQGEHGERALTLTFFGDRTPYPGVEQGLALSPGRHVLSGWSAAEGLQGDRGLVWRAHCRSDRGEWKVLATTRPEYGSHGWLPFSTEFVVPDEGCTVQLLRIESASLAALDTIFSGSVSYSRLAVSKE